MFNCNCTDIGSHETILHNANIVSLIKDCSKKTLKEVKVKITLIIQCTVCMTSLYHHSNRTSQRKALLDWKMPIQHTKRRFFGKNPFGLRLQLASHELNPVRLCKFTSHPTLVEIILNLFLTSYTSGVYKTVSILYIVSQFW